MNSTQPDQPRSLISRLLLPCDAVNRLCDELGVEYRERVYSPAITIWLFINQCLSTDHSCQEVVNRLNAWRVERGLNRCSSDTSSYCKARRKLPLQLFEKILQWTAGCCDKATEQQWLFHGREVEVVDGTVVTMADTPDNQAKFPQPASQRPGCGFPMARLLLCFSLASGVVERVAMAKYAGKLTGETSLLRTIIDMISPGKILLADRFYANYWILAMSEMRGIDIVARAHQLRKIDFRGGYRLGYFDQLVGYRKPQRPKWMSLAEYDRYPDWIIVRHLRYRVTRKGFRTREVTLATTLLDHNIYTAEDLADLYRRRWQVELHIRSLKTQMQMEHLRCKSAEMVQKEIYCHLISYNLVRAAMVASALKYRVTPADLSFTGAMQALREFAVGLRRQDQQGDRQWENLLETISEVVVGKRPGRKEPRVKKRRPKNYKLMRQPRKSITNRQAMVA